MKERFIEIYGESNQPIRLFHSPGRVNIIGEHTDYNGGYVLPTSLEFGTFAAFRLRDDNIMRFTSENFELKVQMSLDDMYYDKANDWANYPIGIVMCLRELGFTFGGFDVLFSGNMPNGAGLSSSASIELAMAVALNTVFNLGIDMISLVKLAQKSENTINGVSCGIMDQFAVGMGKKDMAILLKCDSLDYEYTPLKLNGYKLVICNTNKQRSLSDSKYNERRNECQTAVEILRQRFDIENLSQLKPKQLMDNLDIITDKTIQKRAKHVVTENERVMKSVEALKSNNIAALGKLMVESHNSLRDDYDVTGIELDTIVEYALRLPYVLGARMTGAGFGGCAIAIVECDKVKEFEKEITESYTRRIGYSPSIYIAETGHGAREII